MPCKRAPHDALQRPAAPGRSSAATAGGREHACATAHFVHSFKNTVERNEQTPLLLRSTIAGQAKEEVPQSGGCPTHVDWFMTGSSGQNTRSQGSLVQCGAERRAWSV